MVIDFEKSFSKNCQLSSELPDFCIRPTFFEFAMGFDKNFETSKTMGWKKKLL